MSIRNTPASYGCVTKLFHWAIALLVIAMLIYGYFLSSIPKQYAGLAYNIHKLTGVLIFCLVILRLLWAFVNVKPAMPNTSRFERLLEHTVHYALYIFLLVMPLAGWIGASSAGRGPHLGDVALNLPVPHDKALGSASFDVHDTVAIILIVLISFHVLAALFHHFLRKDEVLVRMMP